MLRPERQPFVKQHSDRGVAWAVFNAFTCITNFLMLQRRLLQDQPPPLPLLPASSYTSSTGTGLSDKPCPFMSCKGHQLRVYTHARFLLISTEASVAHYARPPTLTYPLTHTVPFRHFHGPSYTRGSFSELQHNCTTNQIIAK